MASLEDPWGSDDEDTPPDNKLVINKRYAQQFERRQQRLDLQRAADSSSSNSETDEDDEEEDDQGHLLTTRLDTDIAKTLHALRTKDARIYNPHVRFFASDDEEDDDSDSDGTNPQPRRHQPKRYKDVVREQALAQMQQDNDDDDDAESNPKKDATPTSDHHRLAYDTEQQAIRQSFLQTIRDNDKHSDNDDDLLVVVKPQTPAEPDADEAAFVAEMHKLQQSTSTTTTDAANKLKDPKGEVDDGEQFLFRYFQQRAWKEKDDSDDDSSSSTSEPDKKDQSVPIKQTAGRDDDDDDASLDQLDQTDDFEAQYNFRFEDVAAATTASGADYSLVSYARHHHDDSLRRTDTRRREQRAARKARKEAARKAKEEELKRLKNLKKQEMQRKLRQVKQVMGLATSSSDGDAGDVDEAAILKLMEGDYDPEDFERKMQETFGDNYYAQEDKEWKTDVDVRESLRKDEDGNLLVGQDGEEGGLYDDDATEEEQDHDEYWKDDDDEMGDEGDAEAMNAEEGETQLEKKLKSKMQEELYKLDYEDIVAGMPTRFKYRQVEANDYGLTTEEILLARDSTLKQYVSLKKMAPYREDGEYHAGAKRRRRFREMVQHQIDEELRAAGETGEEVVQEAPTEETVPHKRKRRRVKKKKSTGDDNGVAKQPEKVSEVVEPEATEQELKTNEAPTAPKRRRRQKKKKSATVEQSTEHQANSVPAAGNEKQVGRDRENNVCASEKDATNAENAKKKKKKHKKLHKEGAISDDKKRKKKKLSVEGVSDSRLASYGL